MGQTLKLVLLCFLVFFSCKKESKTENIIGSIDISDANSLLFGSAVTDKFAAGDLSDSSILFKQTLADEIHPVTYLTGDGGKLNNVFIPDGIYTLTSKFFLLNVYLKGDDLQKIQSYIVNKTDGNAHQLKDAIVPHRYYDNSWIKGYPDGGFVTANKETLFIPDGDKIIKLSINSDGTGNTTPILLNDPGFAVDTFGNLISGNIIEYLDKSRISISEVNSTSLLVKNFDSGFYVIDFDADTLRINNIDLDNTDYSITNLFTIVQNSSQWKHLGNATIRNLNGSLLMFDKAILFIDLEEAKLISFSMLSLQSISSFYVSNDALFIIGKNVLNKEVFLRINPKSNPVTFTHVFAPDSYLYHLMQMSPEGGFSFYAGKADGSNDVIGFRSATNLTSILDNEFNINVKQVLPLK